MNVNQYKFWLLGFSIAICAFNTNGQSISTDLSFGAGSSYIIEDIQEDTYTNYAASSVFAGSLKYQQLESYFGIKLQFMHVNTLFSGQYINNFKYKGEASTLTTSLLLEHLNTRKKLNIGYNFGIGATHENYKQATYIERRLFPSISLSGLVNFQFSENSSIKLQPTILWTDPINSMLPSNWKKGREDLNAYVLLGYCYRFSIK